MALVIDELTLAHRRDIVVHEFSMTCLQGDVVALVGPNGAGKSTFLRALFGTHRPASGSITFKNRRLDALSGNSRQAGTAYMPQDNSANGSLTALETVLLGSIEELSLRLPEPVIRRAAAALERFEMLEFSHRRIETLSGGQRQLVYFAQALMRDPEILLLDEPVSALDLRHQMLLMAHVREATKANGLVTIVVLHDLGLATRFADRLVVLHEGRVVAQGSPSSVITADLLRSVYGVESSVQRGPDGQVWVRVEGAVAQ